MRQNRFFGSLILSTCVAGAADAGTTYQLEVVNLNQTYTSTMTLSGNGSSRNISQVTSLFVNGGTQTAYSGFSSGQFSWNAANDTLDIHYTVASSSFSLSLTGVVWPGAVSGGFPSGEVSSWNNFGSGAPKLTIAGGFSYQWNFGNLQYIEPTVGSEAPVPGVGGVAAIAAAGLVGRRRRR
ncbi:MAG: hypothetical protein CMJ23_07535 [Phycisphaerae bacterium]|nr:hypothetical protein [Phycisphaerae bacterium]